jgi:hypothetical protein
VALDGITEPDKKSDLRTIRSLGPVLNASEPPPECPIKFLEGTRVVQENGRTVICLPTCTVPGDVELVQVDIPANARTVDLDRLLEEQLGIQIAPDRALETDRAKR